MKIFDKIDTNKNVLIQLFKADIPFVSQLASTRLISKHNMKGKDINKLKEDAPTNSVASFSANSDVCVQRIKFCVDHFPPDNRNISSVGL